MCSGMKLTVPGLEQGEGEWADWLSGLAAWELHYLTSSFRELDWHDDFMHGIVTLDEMSDLIHKVHDKRPADAHSVKV